MMCVGVVTKITNTTACVTVSHKGACGHCSDQAGCGLVLFSRQNDEFHSVTALNPVQAKPGDLVELDFSGSGQLYASTLVWGLPLSGLVGGACLGATISDQLGISENVAALLGCILGLFTAWIALKIINRRIAVKQTTKPRISRIIKTQTSEEKSPDS